MYSRTMPLLYRVVDLRLHGRTRLWMDAWFPTLNSSNPTPDKVENFFEKLREPMSNLRARQNSFVAAMLKDTSLARHVVSLTWTCQRPPQQSREEEQNIWKVFALLSNVKNLDITFFIGYFSWRNRAIAPPPPLFPHASRIRIGGHASYAILRAITSSPSQMLYLALDNIQAFDQSQDGHPMAIVPSLSDAPETEDEEGWPLLRHAGPMHGHLRPLMGQCSNLQELYFCVMGQQHANERNWPDKREAKRYSEMAEFIDSVKATLRDFTFGQASYLDIFRMSESEDDSDMEDLVQPMDARFQKHLFPTLLCGPWPLLECMTICGGAGSGKSASMLKYSHEVVRPAKEELNASLPERVDFKWHEWLGELLYRLEPNGIYR